MERDPYDTYWGITSEKPALRDSAVEFVDNLIDYGTRRYLLPLLDDPKGERAVQAGARFFNRRIRHWEMAQDYLETVDDPRLSTLLDPNESDDGSPTNRDPADGPPESTTLPHTKAE